MTSKPIALTLALFSCSVGVADKYKILNQLAQESLTMIDQRLDTYFLVLFSLSWKVWQSRWPGGCSSECPKRIQSAMYVIESVQSRYIYS